MSLKGCESACWALIVSMEAGERLSLEQIRAVMAGTEGIRFEGKDRGQVYEFVGRTLHEQRYDIRKSDARGLLRAYIGRMTGLSRAQVTPLISSFVGQARDEGEALPTQPVPEHRH